MKPNPHKLTSRLALLLAVFAALWPASAVLSFQEGSSPAPDDEAKAPQVITRADLNADEILNQVRATFESADSVACELKQTVFVGGRKLVATGKYGQAAGNRMRLEYQLYAITAMTQQDITDLALDAPAKPTKPEAPKTDDPKTAGKKAAGETGGLKPTGTMIQISDGSVLWSHWDNVNGRLLTRRNIQDILTASEGLEDYGKVRSLRDIGAGGMQALIAQLQNGMEFGAVQEQKIGGVDFLILIGRWSEATRTDIFGIDPNQENVEKLVFPEAIPDYVRIYVQKDSMLPRRVQYLKRFPSAEVKQVRPMSTLDLLNIKTGIDFAENTFNFQVPEGSDPADVKDLTTEVIESMKRIAKARKDAKAAKAAAKEKASKEAAGETNATDEAADK